MCYSCDPWHQSLLQFLYSFCALHLFITTAWASDEASETQVVNHVFYPFNVIFDSISAFAQNIVLEVEKLESGKEVFEEGADGHGKLKVAEGYCIGGEAAEFLSKVCERQEVLLNSEMESITILQISGNYIRY